MTLSLLCFIIELRSHSAEGSTITYWKNWREQPTILRKWALQISVANRLFWSFRPLSHDGNTRSLNSCPSAFTGLSIFWSSWTLGSILPSANSTASTTPVSRVKVVGNNFEALLPSYCSITGTTGFQSAKLVFLCVRSLSKSSLPVIN